MSNTLTVIGLESRSGRGLFARHALGARFLDFLIPSQDAQWSQLGNTAEECSCVCDGNTLRLIRPVADYNECGDALRSELLDLRPGSFVVVHDETDLELGEWRVVRGGPVNGNKGLQSIAVVLGGDSFTRIAIGVGRPQSTEDTHQFFGTELEGEDRQRAVRAFQSAWAGFCEERAAGHLAVHPDSIPPEVAWSVQVPGRTANLAIAPSAVRLTRDLAHGLNQAVNALTRVTSGVINRYAQGVGGEVQWGELVELLDQGIPREMIPLVHARRHSLQHVSFDFRGGRLIEMNAAPLPPFAAPKIRERLGQVGPGTNLELSVLCAAVVRWATKLAREHGRSPKILLLNRMGGSPVGETWHPLVESYLRSLGYLAVAGTTDEHPDADIIWSNMTWMTPDRWPSVLSAKVLAGEALVFPSPRNFLFTSKWFLKLLCDPRARRTMGIEEGRDVETIRQAVLYTTELESDFVAFALRQGLRLYGKPCLSSGGRGGMGISKTGDVRKIERPAIVQEWTDPHVSSTGLPHEIRIVVYGDQAEIRIWQANCWQAGDKLQSPLVAPVLFES